MTTNIINDLVRATGFTRMQEVELWYALHKSLQVLCAQLDADGGVTDTDYEALCWTAIINCKISNSQGNTVGVKSSDLGFYTLAPTGLPSDARHWLMYNFVNAWETLCEKLDADAGITDTDYEANCYTATLPYVVKDPKGVTDLGNGTVFYFGQGGMSSRKYLIEWFYGALNSLETLTEQLDADGGVTDTDYEANTYTAYCTVRVENSAGSVIGN